MAILSQKILQDLGINLDDASLALLADHFETTLQNRVIEEIINELTVEQAEELAQLQTKTTSDEELYNWLVLNVPQLAEIVSDEVDILLGELAENTDAINGVA